MATSPGSEYARSYTSFGGVDIKAVFGDVVIGELQAISLQVTREKAGVYTMGSPNPRSISRGKRGFAGSLIFIHFDRDAFLFAMKEKKFQGDKDELRPENDPGSTSLEWELTSESGITAAAPLGAGIGGSGELGQQESDLTSAVSDQIVLSPALADQVLPFDITLAANNEYGDSMKMAIFGVEILNEGFGVSVDDLVIEKQYTYLCRNCSWWTKVDNPNASEIYGI